MSPGRSNKFSHTLKQTAVYWGNPVNDGEGGRTFDEAVEISVRWEDKSELFLDANGQEIRSHSIVQTSQDVDVGGYLYLGDLDDLSSDEEGDPFQVSGAREIRQFNKIPDIRGTVFFRKVYL